LPPIDLKGEEGKKKSDLNVTAMGNEKKRHRKRKGGERGRCPIPTLSGPGEGKERKGKGGADARRGEKGEEKRGVKQCFPCLRIPRKRGVYREIQKRRGPEKRKEKRRGLAGSRFTNLRSLRKNSRARYTT